MKERVRGGADVAVKVCGLCSEADAAAAAAAGADYAGVILAPGLPRSRTAVQARAILDAAAVRRVGVFVDASPEEVLRTAEVARLDVVQLHGAETPDAAAALRGAGALRVWKVVRLRESGDASSLGRVVEPYLGVVDGVLLEGWSARGHGGVGAPFDWTAVAGQRGALGDLRLIVAGGLNPDNVARAVALLRPDIVDVSSGVEEATCRKSEPLMRAFVAAVRSPIAVEGSG